MNWKSGSRRFSAIIRREGRFFIARCPELGVTSQGKSPGAAGRNIKEAVALYLESFGQAVRAVMPKAKKAGTVGMRGMKMHSDKSY